MSKIIGLDGQPIEEETPGSMTDAESEALGAGLKDVNAVDDLGVPYFFPLDHPKEELRGKRIPRNMRLHMRKRVKKHQKQQKEFLNTPIVRHEFLGFLEGSFGSLVKQTDNIIIMVRALRQLCIKADIFTLDEYRREFHFQNTIDVLQNQRLRAFQQNVDPRVLVTRIEETAGKEKWAPKRADFVALLAKHDVDCETCTKATQFVERCNDGKKHAYLALDECYPVEVLYDPADYDRDVLGHTDDAQGSGDADANSGAETVAENLEGRAATISAEQ